MHGLHNAYMHSRYVRTYTVHVHVYLRRHASLSLRNLLAGSSTSNHSVRNNGAGASDNHHHSAGACVWLLFSTYMYKAVYFDSRGVNDDLFRVSQRLPMN